MELRRARQGDVPLSGLAQLLLFTLSIHGNTRPAQYGIAYKKVNVFCHLSSLLKSLQASASVVWLKHQHMCVKKYMTGCDRHVSCPYPRNRRAANRPGALPEHGGAGRSRTARGSVRKLDGRGRRACGSRTAAAGSGEKRLFGRSAPRCRKKQTGVCAIPFGGCQRRERRPWQCQPYLRRRAPSAGSLARRLRYVLLFRRDRRAAGLCRWLTSRPV